MYETLEVAQNIVLKIIEQDKIKARPISSYEEVNQSYVGEVNKAFTMIYQTIETLRGK